MELSACISWLQCMPNSSQMNIMKNILMLGSSTVYQDPYRITHLYTTDVVNSLRNNHPGQFMLCGEIIVTNMKFVISVTNIR